MQGDPKVPDGLRHGQPVSQVRSRCIEETCVRALCEPFSLTLHGGALTLAGPRIAAPGSTRLPFPNGAHGLARPPGLVGPAGPEGTWNGTYGEVILTAGAVGPWRPAGARET